jgi:lipoprotein-anchoring transpeptidase ErfK/SrfK
MTLLRRAVASQGRVPAGPRSVTVDADTGVLMGTGSSEARPPARRVASALLVVVAVLLVGCEAGPEAPSGSAAKATARASVSAVRINVTPDDGARGVAPNAGVTVRVDGGSLTAVTVTGPGGDEVAGALGEQGASWSSREQLRFATRYSVVATATDRGGTTRTTRSTFTTVTPRKLLHTAVVPLNGETVGVGLPIQVAFSDPVRNRAAVEHGLSVQSTPKVTGAWRWISDEKVRYRPKSYWPAGTKVTLRIRLTGVDAGNGVYGDETRDISFTVGRSVVSVVDAKRLRMTVYINGKPARTIPVTTGKKGWETRNGIKVALEKHPVKIMDAATVGIPRSSPEYYRLRVRLAVRMTWSGEFVHGAEWSTAAQGRTRVSHGCVGMSIPNATWFFAQTRRGDVIRVINSPTTRKMELDNGFGDWNLPWEQWVAA